MIGRLLVLVNQVLSINIIKNFNNMKIVIKTLQGKQLPLEVEETYTVSSSFVKNTLIQTMIAWFRLDRLRRRLKRSTRWQLTLRS